MEAGKLFGGQAEPLQRIAETSLAVTTPAAADFLLEYLEQTNLKAARAPELLRHTLFFVKAEQMERCIRLIQRAQDAPLAEQLPIAAAVAEVARSRNAPVPEQLG